MVVYKEIHGTVIGKGKLDIFIPKTTVSIKWKHWKAVLDPKTCEPCRNRHGKIYPMNKEVNPSLEMHDFCRCMVLPMRAAEAGNCSYEGENGADWWLWNKGILPDAPGSIWFEADLNDYRGKRNGHRVLWSNDGLMFVTYNHYESFIEVIGG